MMLSRLGKVCISSLLFFCSVAGIAAEDADPIERTGFLPAVSSHANWVFSGVVMNESGEQYAYFFRMQRHEKEFHAIAALFDAQNKKLIFLDEERAVLDNPEQYNWHVGHSFLRFNVINDSWVFGLKTDDKKGFNFKVDMLNQPENNPIAQDLREGVEFIVSQTGQLNGHVLVGDERGEEFVTAKNAWFQQLWLTNLQAKSHRLSSALCRFNDGSGFYSMNLLEPDAVRGAVAGWFDPLGASFAMSQFINVKEADDGAWHINIASPNLHLTLSDTIKQSSVVAGFIAEQQQQGFCMLSQDAMGMDKLILNLG